MSNLILKQVVKPANLYMVFIFAILHVVGQLWMKSIATSISLQNVLQICQTGVKEENKFPVRHHHSSPIVSYFLTKALAKRSRWQKKQRVSLHSNYVGQIPAVMSRSIRPPNELIVFAENQLDHWGENAGIKNGSNASKNEFEEGQKHQLYREEAQMLNFHKTSIETRTKTFW